MMRFDGPMCASADLAVAVLVMLGFQGFLLFFLIFFSLVDDTPCTTTDAVMGLGSSHFGVLSGYNGAYIRVMLTFFLLVFVKT